MTPSLFDSIHSFTLCIDVEISTTQYYIQNEAEFRFVLGEESIANSLIELQKKYHDEIATPFYEVLFNPIASDLDNHNDMDYLFAYAQIEFFQKAQAFNKEFLDLTGDQYLLVLIHSDIHNSYPGIQHNPKFFPHAEAIQFLTKFANGK
jgi:hypothetical protein